MTALEAILQIVATLTVLVGGPLIYATVVGRRQQARTRRALAHAEARPDADGLRLEIGDERAAVPSLRLIGERLPRGIWVGPTAEGGAPWHIEQIYTRDDDFDRVAWVRSGSPLAVYATLGVDERAALTRLVAVGGLLRDGLLEVPAQAHLDLGFSEGDMLKRRIDRIRGAGRALVLAGAPPHDRLLTHLRADPCPGFRHQCLLMAIDGPRASQAIRIGLADPDLEVRYRAARHAGAAGVELLCAAAGHADPSRRAEVYAHLAHADREALRAVLDAVIARGPGAVVAYYARPALRAAAFHEVRGLSGVAAWVDHEEGGIALDALTLLVLDADREGLLAALYSRHRSVVERAAEALADDGSAEVLPALEAARKGRGRALSASIGRAINRIRERHAGRAGGLALVEEVLDGRVSVSEEGGALSPVEGR